MISRFAKWLFEDVWGWKIVGPIPTIPKYLIVVAPHTSNWDFLVGVLFRRYTKGFDPKYLAKKELFVWPLGYLFRGLGGFPVERSANTNFVDSLVNVYNNEEKFVTTITPEGTRSYNPKWKTGFYHVAKNANVPIVRVAFDFGQMQVVFSEPYTITKDVDDTIAEFKQYFSHYKGKNPEDGVKWPE
jgi:1-acyl-sn-glycerol-3-phosphate acyltransferase